MKSKFIITFIFFALAAFGAKAETAVRDTVPVTKRGITPPRNLQNYDPSQAAGKFGQVMGVKRYSGTAGDTMVGYLPFYVLSASEAYLGTDRLVTAGNISSYAPATDLGYTAATRVLTSSTGTDVTLPLSSSTAPGLLPTLGTSLQLARVNSAGTSLEYFTPSYLTAVTGTARFSGSGTSGSPLELAQQSAATGQGLGWNGAYWAPWTFFHTASARFSGAGTAASPLELAQQSATSGQVLTWNGTSWAPAAPSGGVTGSGTANQLTYWNGTSAVTGDAMLTKTSTALKIETNNSGSSTPQLIINSTGSQSLINLFTASSGSTPSADGFAFAYGGLDAYILNREAGSTYLGNSGAVNVTITPTGNFGVGVTPTEKVHVSGNILIASGVLKLPDGSASAPAYTWAADTNTGLFRPTADVLGFATDGAERMRVSATGNVGIGTTSPGARMHLNTTTSSGAPETQLTLENDANNTGEGVAIDFRDAAGYMGSIRGVTGSNATKAVSIAAGDTPTEIARFSVGGVGIGTTAPVFNLHVADNSLGYSYTHLTTAATGHTASDGFTFGLNAQSNCIVYNREPKSLIFGTSATERMRIDSVGRVGIGTTSPAQPLHVVGNLQWTGAAMPNGSAGTAGQVLTSAGAGAPPTWASAGTIGGTAAANRVAYGDGTNSLTSTANFTYTSGVLEAARSAGASIRVAYSAGSVYTDVGTNSSGYGFLSPTGKRLGVNTTGPLATLHVQNDGTNTQGGLFIDHNSGTMSTGNELQLDLALGGTAMARVAAVKESTGYGLKLYTGGAGAVNGAAAIAITGADDITIGTTASTASINFQGPLGTDDYQTETANSGTLAAKSWHYIDPTAAAAWTLPGSMNDGTWLFVVNQDGTFDITISAPGGETLTGSATITAGKTGMFHKSGTVWYRITF